MSKATDFLKAHQGKTPSKWRDSAQWQKDNWPWLKHSYGIAIKTRSRMRELGITQKKLAEKLGCSQQYVSLLLGGKENLTLETISRIEIALDFNLLVNTSSLVSGYKGIPEEKMLLVADPQVPYGSSE